MSLSNVFTVDLEEWFHLLGNDVASPIEKWDRFESRIEEETYSLLSVLSENKIKATFFVLAWVAERHKKLIQEIAYSGHEVASHGYAHFLYNENKRVDVIEDLKKSKAILEDIIGKEITGFRSPGFSATKDNMWLFSEIYNAGYKYDSSAFPALRFNGGNRQLSNTPFIFNNGLREFPIGVMDLYNCKFPLGGGYFRLYPSDFSVRLIKAYNKKYHKPLVFYIHPRECDPLQPRIKSSPMRYFRTYVNIDTTLNKIKKVLNSVKFGPTLQNLMLTDLL